MEGGKDAAAAEAAAEAEAVRAAEAEAEAEAEAAARVAAARAEAEAEAAEEAIPTSRGNQRELEREPADLARSRARSPRGFDGRGRLGRRLDAGGVTTTGRVRGSTALPRHGVQLFTRPAARAARPPLPLDTTPPLRPRGCTWARPGRAHACTA